MKRLQPSMVTKRSLMLGLGEAGDEVLQAMKSIKHSISVSQSIYNSSNTYTYKYFVDKFSCQRKETLIEQLTFTRPSTTQVALLFLLF